MSVWRTRTSAPKSDTLYRLEYSFYCSTHIPKSWNASPTFERTKEVTMGEIEVDDSVFAEKSKKFAPSCLECDKDPRNTNSKFSGFLFF